ncbi:glycoside hydrolase family 16 protein [Halorhabdus sp. BNX81]|uniref:glycoside hydrolase family 16 protein n=1 Tax=Halorhabdus sp. BNX81 TaxID=2980181 RepID=UPI0023DD2CB5|nr:glycoside hydrolase family 16 protein [Halorhabdus sp. BNX81]WEL22370.1 Laminarinase, glycosyl hydrolase family 16 [Halorhabdus sp. BNX81]
MRTARERPRRAVDRRTVLGAMGSAISVGAAGCSMLDGGSSPTDATESATPTDGSDAPTSPEAASAEPNGDSWDLSWSDEFDGEEIDEAVWSFETGNGHPDVPGWGNEEPQYYQRENAWVEDDHLVIEAREEHVEDDYGEYDYTSSRLHTQGTVATKYGRVDIRARLPRGQGIWPRIWMVGSDVAFAGWPDCGEIDILEFRGDEPETVRGFAQGPGYTGADRLRDSYTVEEGALTDSTHVFSIRWQSDRIEWYVDETQYHTVSRETVEDAGHEWVFDTPMYFVLAFACGGDPASYPDETTPFPQRLEVDYVRHYERV